MIDPKDIDWNLVWKSQVEENRASSPGRDCARIWESRESALRFWNMCRKERSRIDQTVWETDMSPSSRVLDIGAGPGTLAIPFAQKAAHVTAIEPAEGMCSVMKEKMTEFAVSNIDIVQKRWEDVDIASDLSGPYDVVIASFSLGMGDIQSAVEKMVGALSPLSLRWPFILGYTMADLMAKIARQALPARPQERCALQCALSDGNLPQHQIFPAGAQPALWFSG